MCILPWCRWDEDSRQNIWVANATQSELLAILHDARLPGPQRVLPVAGLKPGVVRATRLVQHILMQIWQSRAACWWLLPNICFKHLLHESSLLHVSYESKLCCGSGIFSLHVQDLCSTWSRLPLYSQP